MQLVSYGQLWKYEWNSQNISKYFSFNVNAKNLLSRQVIHSNTLDDNNLWGNPHIENDKMHSFWNAYLLKVTVLD